MADAKKPMNAASAASAKPEIKSEIELEEDEYLVNGKKAWIPNLGRLTGLFLVHEALTLDDIRQMSDAELADYLGKNMEEIAYARSDCMYYKTKRCGGKHDAFVRSEKTESVYGVCHKCLEAHCQDDELLLSFDVSSEKDEEEDE